MSLPTLLAFDEFELRLDSGELFREGALAAQLQPQPAKLLELLASRAGEVVSREEIRQLVWGDSFVDFDASLNFCVKQLRRALGDSAISPRHIETLPRRGYRFLRPVRRGPEGLAPPAEVVPERRSILAPVPSPPAPKARGGLLTGFVVTAAALILLVFLIASRFAPPPLHPRLTVFPLACQGGNPADRQICGGVTEALTAEITRRFPQDLEVIAPTSTLVYEGSRKSPRDIGKELGATHVLTGAVETSSGRLRITARLATTGGRNLWEDNFDGELMDIPRVYEQIARRVAMALRLPLPAAPAVNARPSQAASEAYLQGTYLRHRWNFAEATKSLEDAVLLAPRYAPAFAELALARTERGVPPQDDAPASRAAAQQALQLDPRLPEAHLAMANVLFKDLVDWQEAGAEYRQALLLSPRNAEILHGYANYLMALGRYDDALAYVNRARELDPASMEVVSDYAWFLFLAGHYEEAVREARSTLTLVEMTQAAIPPIADFGRSWAYHVLLFASLRMNDEQTALSSARERMRSIGKGADAARIRSVHDLLEWRHKVVASLVAGHPGTSYLLAQTAAASGRLDEALDALEQECRNGGEGMLFNYVAVEPLFEKLHGDPRFAKIVDCTRLPQDAPARLALQTKIAAR
jgi:DNA-binding winged helix-turn-helix (wHTH) protein/TolB-like protein/cytochrome c-type biogenesis protein CcmH/NrfG